MADYLFNRTKSNFRIIPKRKIKPTETYDNIPAECCFEYNVLADLSDPATSWKNDITSAWFRLDDSAESGDLHFKLYKADGTLATYQPTKTAFVVNPYGSNFYATIDWNDVLSSDGEGCYTYKVEYIVGGVAGNIEWGNYNLKAYSSDNAKHQVRLRVLLNQYQSIEGIDFTGSKVVDTIRLNGFFGNREPNMVTDNLIYQDRKSYNVQREVLNTYVLNTDPIMEELTEQILDLYLLSECELYISDHNPFNHTTQFKDLPVIVDETPTIEYMEFSKFAKITAKVSDKEKNNLSKYNG